jgi:hypothetical protein
LPVSGGNSHHQIRLQRGKTEIVFRIDSRLSKLVSMIRPNADAGFMVSSGNHENIMCILFILSNFFYHQIESIHLYYLFEGIGFHIMIIFWTGFLGLFFYL